MTQGNGMMLIVDENGKIRYFSRHLMCPETGLSYPLPAPHTFSFNSPSGWCPCCKGLGKVKSDELKAKSEAEQAGEIDEAIKELYAQKVKDILDLVERDGVFYAEKDI